MVAAPDKFRGTASAAAVAAAVERAATGAGWTCDPVPVADGGEGTLAALGGPNRTTMVTGPLGDPIEAPWRLHRGTAVVESALASGLDLVGGAEGNDAVTASTYGTGELIGQAVELGARRVIVGVGGSATTDGGLGALRALHPVQRLRGIEIVVAADVRTAFVDAAEQFAPQKGASAAEVELLRRRLQRLAQVYEEDHGVDVTTAVAVRSLGTAVFVIVLLRFAGVSLRVPAATLRRGLSIGVLIAVQSWCLYSAVARIPVALALLAFNTFPIMLGLISWMAGGERPARRTLIAMPIALAGLALALDIAGLVAGGTGGTDAAAGAIC